MSEMYHYSLFLSFWVSSVRTQHFIRVTRLSEPTLTNSHTHTVNGGLGWLMESVD